MKKTKSLLVTGLVITSAIMLVGCNDEKDEKVKPQTSNKNDITNGSEQIKGDVEVETEGIKRDEYDENGIREVVTDEGEKFLEKEITLYRADKNVEYVEGYKSTYPMEKGQEFNLLNFITFLTNQSNTLKDTVLLESVSFIEEDKLVLLNFGTSIEKVQGSTGGLMFMGTITETIFANTKEDEVKAIMFAHPEADAILDHVSVNEPITRSTKYTEPTVIDN